MLKHFEIINGTLSPTTVPSSVQLHVRPSREEISLLTTELNIDEHTLFSALDPDEVPRIELEPDHFAIIWKRPKNFSSKSSVKFAVTSIGAFIFKEHMEILSSEEMSLIEGKHFNKVTSHLDVLLKMLSRTIHHFLGHLKVMDALSNEMKEKVNTAMENKYLLQMFELSECLVYYLNAISSNGMVLEKLRHSGSRLGLTPEQLELLEDLQIENNQCYKQADIFSNILTGLMDARGTVVNNNVNTHLQRLTLINTIFLPLNLIASIGGMSEFTMMTKPASWKIAYLVFSLSMVVIGILTYFLINPAGRRNRSR